MSIEFWLRGRLEFRDATAIGDAKQALAEEGCEGHEDNLLGDDDLKWTGTVLTVESKGFHTHALRFPRRSSECLPSTRARARLILPRCVDSLLTLPSSLYSYLD